MPPDNSHEMEDTNQLYWSTTDVVDMLAISAICVLLSAVEIDNLRTTMKTLFKILVKLPTNTHAISHITVDGMPSMKYSVGVHQVRRAYGVYKFGSAINHSCRFSKHSFIRFICIN